MATELKVNTLSEYVEQHKEELMTKAVLGANTLEHIDIMPNVKYKDTLNYLDSKIVLADGTVCGWNPQGSDEFTQRTVEVHPLKVNKEWCDKDFRKYYMNYQLLFEAGRETLPFEAQIMENNTNAIKAELEKQIWQNEKDDSTMYFDGIVKIVSDENDSVKIELAQGYSAIDVIDKAYEALTPVMLLQEPTIFVSHSTFRNYIQALNAVCCANRPIQDANVDEFVYPGDSRVTIVPVTGLEGADKTKVLAVASPAKNIVYATDVEGSENTYKFWYSDETEKFKFRVIFNAGVQVKFPDQIVLVKAQGE